jgi:hypothetical protein
VRSNSAERAILQAENGSHQLTITSRGRRTGTNWLLPFKFGGSMIAAADTGH